MSQQALSPSGYLIAPSLHQQHLIFHAENDLWHHNTVSNYTYRLTYNQHTNQVQVIFSPDGLHIAFVAAPEGYQDIYLMPLSGGHITRLTYLGGVKQINRWSSDNTLTFIGTHESAFQEGHAYSINLDTKNITRLPFGPCEDLCFDPHTSNVVIQRHGYGYTAHKVSWKRYKGGTAGQLWIKQPSSPFKQLFTQPNNVIMPRWHQDSIYFLSDFEDHGNIYSCKPDGSSLTRHTHHEDFYVRGFCISEDTLIYSCGGSLYRKNIQHHQELSSLIPIPYPSQQAAKQGRFEESNALVTHAALSHDTNHIAIIKRGYFFCMPTWQGGINFCQNTERYRHKGIGLLAKTHQFIILADNGFSDVLLILNPQTSAITTTIDLKEHGRIMSFSANPITKQICLTNQKHQLILLELDHLQSTLVDQGDYEAITEYDWSADGLWLAYAKSISSCTAQIILYDCTKQTYTPITSPLFYAHAPHFDEEGQYLFYLCNNHYQASMDGQLFQYNFHKSTKPYLCLLRKDQQNPFTYRIPIPQKPTKKAPSDAKDNLPKTWKIDIKNIEHRNIPLPVEAGDYSTIQYHQHKCYLTTHDSDRQNQVIVYDLTQQSQEILYEGIVKMALCFQKDWSLLVYKHNKIRLVKTGEKLNDHDTSYRKGGWINLSRIKPLTQPHLEWQRILKEAWRLQKDFYWDKNLGHLDWDNILKKYQGLLPKINSRQELNDLIAEMQGELGASHAYIWGGDIPDRNRIAVGHLGMSLSYEPNRNQYIINQILPNLDPFTANSMNPALSPGLNLKPGDAIIKINGQEVTPTTPPEAILVNLANQQIELCIQRKHKKKHESFTIRTQGNMESYHYRQWVEHNRRHVHQKTKGRIGYIHIPDMQQQGYAEFIRSFLATQDTDGLIIDIRYNRGGHASSMMLQKLILKPFGLDQVRWQKHPIPYPIMSTKDNMVAICNEYTASDGDMFAHAFKTLKMGKLIGQRTWGGVIGINPRNPFIDGGLATQPEYAAWFKDVGYDIENHGVDPDEAITITPEDYHKKQDTQLDRAIQISLTQLKAQNPKKLEQSLAKTLPKALTPRPLPKVTKP